MKTVYFRDPTKENIEAAAKIIRDGGLLAIPTETVYGLGADALNEDAVLRIFLAKGRPQDNPLIIHVPDSSWLARYCENVPSEAVVCTCRSIFFILLSVFSIRRTFRIYPARSRRGRIHRFRTVFFR